MNSRSTYRSFTGVLLSALFLANTLSLTCSASARATTTTKAEAPAAASVVTHKPAATSTAKTTAPPADARERAEAAYARLPVRFEANRGQSDSRVKFLSRVGGYTLFLTQSEAVWALAGDTQTRAKNNRASVLRMKLAGSNPSPAVEGTGQLPGTSNYMIGSDSSRWLSEVPGFARVEYKSVYAGVDLAYYGASGQLEYDFRVAPGADPRAIRLSFAGAQSMRVDAATGDLVLRAGGRELRHHAPVAYQEKDGARQLVASRFRINGRREVGFELGRYDATRSLVIDPTLSYSTYVGGTGGGRASAIAVDSEGNAYVTGFTGGGTFPVTPGAFQTTFKDGPFIHTDYFVTKINASGTALVYSTYLGGTSDEAMVGGGIAVDAGGNAYVTGGSASADFPTTPGAFQTTKAGTGSNSNAVVAKLNPTGTALVYSTFLGGGDEVAYGIAVTSDGKACVTGVTTSNAFPLTANAFQTTLAGGTGLPGDAFITQFNPTGSALEYSTLLGGNGTENFNYSAIAVDGAGKIYVAGKTSSPGQPNNTFPVTAGAFQTTYGGGTADAFAAKIDPAQSGAQSLVYSTFLGGNSLDVGLGIAVDAGGNAYVSGGSFSPNYPVTAGAHDTTNGGSGDIFVTKLNPTGTALVYSTFVGGAGNEAGSAIALDSEGRAWVTGPTGSADYPVTADAYQPVFAGDYDFGVTRLSADGSQVEYSTFLGGSFFDYSTGIAVDSNGDAYVTGYGGGGGFPTTPGAFQPNYLPGWTGQQVIVAKLGPAEPADTAPPSVECGTADGLWHNSNVSIQCTATDGGSGLANASDASFTLTTNVPAGGEDPNASTDSRQVCDVAGNCATAGPVAGNKVDRKAPAVSCGASDGAWHATDVSVACSASDAGSGLANASDSSFSLMTNVAAGTEDANASTDSRQVCDAAGNCSSAGPVGGNKVDKKGPTVTINSPLAQGYSFGAIVPADFNCADAGSGVATCVGTVSSGSPVNTSSFGAKTFTVTATDNAGNVTTQTVNYSVTYSTCLAYEPGNVYQAGRTVPIKLYVCDGSGNNLSSPGIVVTAVGVGLVSTTVYGDVDTSGNANPDNNFRFVGGFYVFNMSTKGLTTGSYYLYYRVGDDPTLHTAPFQIR